LNHHATPAFWACYEALPADVQALADKSFELVNENPKHPSVHLKKVGRYWSARVGIHHRALAIEGRDALVWFWIGPHREYEKIVG
jgi:hypothetical protein